MLPSSTFALGALQSLKKVEKYGVSANLHYIACNANVDYDRIAADINARSRIVRGR